MRRRVLTCRPNCLVLRFRFFIYGDTAGIRSYKGHSFTMFFKFPIFSIFYFKFDLSSIGCYGSLEIRGVELNRRDVSKILTGYGLLCLVQDNVRLFDSYGSLHTAAFYSYFWERQYCLVFKMDTQVFRPRFDFEMLLNIPENILRWLNLKYNGGRKLNWIARYIHAGVIDLDLARCGLFFRFSATWCRYQTHK